MNRRWPPLERLALHSAGTMSYPPGSTFGPRLLTDFELVWIISGDSTVYRNSHPSPAPAGSVLLHRPGLRDAYDWASDQTTLHAFIHFGCASSRRGWPAVARWPMQRALAPQSLVLALFRFILGLNSVPPEASAPVLLPSLELLLRCFVTGKDDVPDELGGPMPKPVTRVFQLVRDSLSDNPARRFRLAQLAREARVSPQHLCRVFDRAFGRGPMECVRLLRIERAATFLERTDDPIWQIAYACGFADPYHFSRLFRSVYGVSPRAHRQEFLLGIERGIVRPRRPAVFGDKALRWPLEGSSHARTPQESSPRFHSSGKGEAEKRVQIASGKKSLRRKVPRSASG